MRPPPADAAQRAALEEFTSELAGKGSEVAVSKLDKFCFVCCNQCADAQTPANELNRTFLPMQNNQKLLKVGLQAYATQETYGCGRSASTHLVVRVVQVAAHAPAGHPMRKGSAPSTYQSASETY